RCLSDWSSDVCSSDLLHHEPTFYVGRGGDHALARDHGRQRAALGRGKILKTSKPLGYNTSPLGVLHLSCLNIVGTPGGFHHGRRSEERRVGKESRCKM